MWGVERNQTELHRAVHFPVRSQLGNVEQGLRYSNDNDVYYPEEAHGRTLRVVCGYHCQAPAACDQIRSDHSEGMHRIRDQEESGHIRTQYVISWVSVVVCDGGNSLMDVSHDFR